MTNDKNNAFSGVNVLPIKRALISVSDKSGVVEFALELQEKHGVEIISTGGTAKTLSANGVKVIDVCDVTGFPEIMDGRVKTLHPLVHGGILARRDDESHVQAMNAHGITGIDMVVVNLYPFEKTVADGKGFEECIENIDIGGPAMIRAAAKNHNHVAVVTDSCAYEDVLADLQNHSGITLQKRKELAGKAFAMTATYDACISAWFAKQDGCDDAPQRIAFSGTLDQPLRYGENPHQKAALYHMDCDDRSGPARATKVQGKKLSYNNLLDADAAFGLVSEFDDPAVAIIKHANPCGVATGGEDIVDIYERALLCDSVSAFGGIIALNRPLDAKTASEIIKRFVEVIIAPSIEAEALDILSKKPAVRVLTTGKMLNPTQKITQFRHIIGGILTQESDFGAVTKEDLNIVSDRNPTDGELADMLFAFKVAKHVKSNAIVYAKDLASVGIGAGQMSRIDSARIAAAKSEDAAQIAGLDAPLAKGSVVASDAFFPFADGLIKAAEAGVSAVIQPGGSIRDQEVIDAANERGLAMVFTGMRHFRI